jgi:PAS domain S-box-containing protein
MALGFIIAAQILDFLIGIGILHFVFLLEYAWLATILAVGLRRSNDFIEAALTRKALERTDEELKDSQATLSTIIDSTADMIWSVDSKTLGLLTFNRSFGLHFSMSRGLEVAVGTRLDELFDSEEEIGQWRDIYKRGIEKGSFSIEQGMGSNSRIFLLSVNRLGRDGRVLGLSVFAQDITERKRAEEQIARSLAEKEVLLREVYHRTKNNMSVIISILRLQSNAIGDERLKEAYGVSINRILSMSSVHDNLYMTDDLSRIDLKHYIKDLAERLTNSYSLPDDRPSLVLEMESMQVTFETAINCGLIVNELITNALKYAFPDKRKGRITIRLGKDEGGRITLAISDDGIGMAPDFDVKRDGHLGLRLITSLAHGKLRGRVAFASQGGFSCSLDFSEAEMAEE